MKKLLLNAAVALSALVATTVANAVGWVDVAHSCAAAGWACDEADPGHTGKVFVIRGDGKFVRTLTPDEPREAAVGAMCSGNANRGFAGDLRMPGLYPDHGGPYPILTT